MPEIGASGSASGDGKRPLPHGLILDAGSMTFSGAGEGNRTLVISLEDPRRFRDITAHSDISVRFAALSAKPNFRLSECPQHAARAPPPKSDRKVIAPARAVRTSRG